MGITAWPALFKAPPTTIVGSATSIIFNTVNVDISDNIIALNTGANVLSENFKDSGIIYERGSIQSNVFAGFTESTDTYVIGYTNDNSDFSNNNINILSYANLHVNDLSFNNGYCNNLVINGTNISTALSIETSNRDSGDASLLNVLSTEISNRDSGDASLSTELSTETSSRLSGDSVLSAGLSTETSSRLSGDSVLSAGLST